MAQTEPDEVDGDIYDEIATLENWQGMLSDLISNNDISQSEFDSEMLKTKYYLDIKTKTYVLDDDDAEILEGYRKSKKSLIENYTYGFVSDKDFNAGYLTILRKEYAILKLSENDQDEKKTSVNIDLDTPLSEKLQTLHEAEVKYNKSVAKKHGILFPKLPIGFNKEQINLYYDNKLTNNLISVIPEIEEYLKKYSATKQLIEYHTSSFEVSKIFYNTETETSNYQFKMVAPISNKLENLRFLEKRGNLLTPEEQAYSDRLNILKDRLRQMTRADILKCASARTVKFMSYIERLRENKQNVIKFKEHPTNYVILKQIVEEENQKYYKIPSDKLFKDYIYARPDILQSFVDETKPDLIEYVEQGVVGYLAIRPGSDLRNLGEGLDSFVTILPFEDELYTELGAKEGAKTEIDKVWELRMSLPDSSAKNIIKRYLLFEDYLKDLKQILINNSKLLGGSSKDIINTKIRKINYYLMYEEDPDIYLQTGHTSVSDLFKNRSEVYKMRQDGLYQLLEFITTYYPGGDILGEKLESDIFDYSSSNYKFNISKFMFLINNFQEKLDELASGTVSIIELLAYETPKTLPEEDVDIRGDKQENIDKLLNWNPDTSVYDTHRSELDNTDHSFYKFKEDHPELSNIEISQIMSQYSESVEWQTSLQNYSRLTFPDGYIELNFRLRYLLRQRNKLPSRRIFTLASVSDRISRQTQFLATFTECLFPDPNKYSVLTENIIYGLSKTPEDYNYYNSLVNSEYKKLCEYLTEVNLISEFEPDVLTPVITEFLVTQGEFAAVDIQRLKPFSENINSDKILSYIENLRGAEIDAYNRSIMEQVNEGPTPLNEIYLKAARALKTAKFKKQLEKLAIISYSTYKPPIISVEKPLKIRHGREYTPEYIKVGDYYIYGGFYPMFNTYSEDGDILSENYKRHDLENLATVFNLDLLEDSFELYKSIMGFMRDYDKKEPVIEKINFNPIEYNTYYEYLKVPAKTITYTFRQRSGVQDPGEVYTVTKDLVRIYGVPFDFNKDAIPIYSEDLKERVDNGFIIIEGPCIFQNTSTDNNTTNDSYINVEYKDSRGKSKIFREGVPAKKIKKKAIDSLNTCSRFASKTSCDDPNSYSLDVKGLKFKCKWLNEICKGVIIESDELKNFDVNKVIFNKNFSKNKLWQTALEKSIRYVEELTKLKELNQEEIRTLSKEQKTRLLNYYNSLNKPKKVLQSVPEEKTEIKGYLLIDKFEDLLKSDNNVSKIQKTITEGYTDFTIYNLKSTSLKLPMMRININSEYIINGDVIIPIEYQKENDSYVCEIKVSGKKIILKKEEFRRKSNEIITKTVPLFCLIKNEDLPLLNDLPGYYWYDKKITYTPTKDDLVKKEELVKMKTVPTNFINPSSLLNGKPLINRPDILDAISRTGFSTLSTDDSFIYYVTNKVNAEKDAVEFAVKNRIDINEMFSKTIGTITLLDVIEEYETKNPKKTISKTEITNIMIEAIKTEDKKQLAEYFVRAKKSKIDGKIIKEAKVLLTSLPDVQETPKEIPVPEPVKPEPVSFRNIYTTSQRR